MNIYEINKENHIGATMWIKSADTRASIILAFNAALVALIVTENSYTHRLSIVFRGEEAAFCDWSLISGITVFVIFIASFIFSSISAFNVVMMDVKRTSCKHNQVFSFVNIVDLERSEYRSKLHELKPKDIEHALEDQAYFMSELASRKMRYISFAWRSLAGSIIFAILFVVLTIFFI